MLRRTPLPEIDVREAARALAHGDLQLVDVREPHELAEVRVEGAGHIPLDRLGLRLDELNRHRRVAFLCRSGGRSAMATRVALGAGYEAVNVRGGVVAWEEQGLPLVRPGGATR